jgi:hypothetical protein
MHLVVGAGPNGLDPADGQIRLGDSPSLVSVAKPYFAAQDRDFRGETGAVLAG